MDKTIVVCFSALKFDVEFDFRAPPPPHVHARVLVSTHATAHAATRAATRAAAHAAARAAARAAAGAAAAATGTRTCTAVMTIGCSIKGRTRLASNTQHRRIELGKIQNA